MMKIKPSIRLNISFKDISCILLLIVLTLLYVLPIFKNISDISHNTDLTSYLSISYFQKLSIVYYKQFPLWSPYSGGGYPIIGNIEDTALTPLMALIVLFGEISAFKLLCVFLYLIGGLGMYYLTRGIFKYSIAGAIFSVLVFVFNPYFYICVSGGDPKQLHYLLYPLLLALFLKGQENQKFLYICSAILTIVFFQADFVALIFLLFVFLYIIPLIFNNKKNKSSFNFSYFYSFSKLILVTFFLGAVKFLPLIQILKVNSRNISNYDLSASQAMSFPELVNNFLGIQNTNPLTYSIGFSPVILAICALFVFRRKLKSLILPLIIITWIALGPHAPFDLWKLFWHLPLFHSQQDLNQYYPIVIVLIIALLSGKLFSISHKNKKCLLLIRIFFIFTVLSYGIVRLTFPDDHFKTFTHPQIRENLDSQEFSQAKILYYADKSSATDINRDFIGPLQYYLIKNNIGTINWKACLQLAENSLPKYYIMPNYFFIAHNPGYTRILNPFYRGEVYCLDKKNTAKITDFSPLILKINVQLKTPDTVIINQNYNKYWHVNLGELFSHNGLIAIKISEPGNYNLEASYIPFDFYLGMGISLLTIILILFFCFKGTKQRSNSLNITEQSHQIKNTYTVYLIIIAGLISQIGQIAYPIKPPSVLINSGCNEKLRQDKEFLKSAKQVEPKQVFNLKPWAVGQYAVYKILDAKHKENNYVYKIAITNKQTFSDQDYFWLEHTLYTDQSHKRAVFRTLRPALFQSDLTDNPISFFSQGIFPKNAKEFTMQFDNDPEIKISRTEMDKVISPLGFSLFSNALFLENYDNSKNTLEIFSKKEYFDLPDKRVECNHLLFNIKQTTEDYQFNLWYSKDIPILGLVQMDLFRLKKDPDYNDYPEKIILVDYGTE